MIKYLFRYLLLMGINKLLSKILFSQQLSFCA